MTDLKRLVRWAKRAIENIEANMRELEMTPMIEAAYRAEIRVYREMIAKIEAMQNEED